MLETFQYRSVVTNWGSERAFIVKSIIFDKNPFTQEFTNSIGETFTVAEHFHKVHKK